MVESNHNQFFVSVYNKNVITETTIKIITNHFAIVIDNPAIPLAPNMKATTAKIINNIASPIRSAIFLLPQVNFVNYTRYTFTL